MKSSIDILVLLGPNGAGKSSIGRMLEARGGGDFFDLERFFVERYDSLDRYRADRPNAYLSLEAELESRIANRQRTVIVEEVGLNLESRQMLARLMAKHRALLVGVIAEARACVARSGARTDPGRFPKTGDGVAAVHRRFTSEVMPSYSFDVTVDTGLVTLTAACDELMKLITEPGRYH